MTAAANTSLDFGAIATDGISLPAGTTAQRPPIPNAVIRYNLDLGQFEGYDLITQSWGALGGGSSGGGYPPQLGYSGI